MWFYLAFSCVIYLDAMMIAVNLSSHFEFFSISRLMLGFMLVTAFISMWITNTATTAMMTPIMEAVLKQLNKENLPEEEGETKSNDINQSETNANENRSSQGDLSQGEVSNSVEAEGKEMIELAAPIHGRGTSERVLVAPKK